MLFSFLLSGFNIFASAFFYRLKQRRRLGIHFLLRTLVFQMLSVLLLPLLFGLDGIWWAIAVAEGFAFLLSLSFLIAARNKYHYL